MGTLGRKGFGPYVGTMFWPKVDLEGGMYPINLKKKESIDVYLPISGYLAL